MSDELHRDSHHPATVDRNRESYNAIAGSWDDARHTFVLREEAYLDALLEGLPAGASVLDLGCGTGRPIAEHILSRGFRVTGVDQAETVLELARGRFPDAAWIASSIEEFETAEQFSAIVFWDALFHIERQKHQRLLARCAMMLEPGGRIMLTVGGSEQPDGFTDEMFGETFYYDSHAPATVLALLGWAGFEPIIAEFMNRPDGGRDKGRFAVVARRK